MRLQPLLLVGALALLPVALTAQDVSSKPASPPPSAPPTVYVRPLPPGQLVDIGGKRRLHVECKGPISGPTVIIEAGLSQFTAHGTYGAAQDSIARFARVCTYDRAGLGWSDLAPTPPTHDSMVEDLHSMLAAISATKPFVLVGHSIGGLLVRRYTQRFPEDVAAVVLLDATPEVMLFTPEAVAERKNLIGRFDAGLANAKPGVPVVAMPAGTPPEVMLAFTPEVMASVRQEYAAIDLVPEKRRDARGYGLLGKRPLVVVRRGKVASPPSIDDERWRSWQEGQLGLSKRSRMVVAEKSGHAIPYDQPGLVADVVQSVLHALGAGK